MRTKGYFVKQLRTTIWQLKGIGIMNLIPIFGLYILIPMTNFMTYMYYKDVNYLYMSIIKECQLFCPILSSWWIYFIMVHLIEEPGNEILYIYEKNKWMNIALPYCVFAMLMIPLYIVYTIIFPMLWWLYFKLLIINLFYAAILYASGFLSGKVVPGVILTLCYTISAYIASDSGNKGISYYVNDVNIGWDFFNEMKIYMLLTAILLSIGIICNNKIITKSVIK